jgi:FkbM family methyltransferase
MIIKILKHLKKTLASTTATEKKSKTETTFTYVFYQPEFGLRFYINNLVEEFRLREWGGEKKYVLDMIYLMNDDDILLDVGASVGLISVTAAKKLMSGKVISIEPDPENKSRLESNYRLNKLTNYITCEMAVGEKKDSVILYTAGSNGYSPSFKKVNGIDRTIIVDVNSIDNLVSENIIPIPTVVKIDVEGAEMMALKGMSNLFAGSKRPRLVFLEIHPEFLIEFNTCEEEIYTFMKGFKYKLIENVERDKQILCKYIRLD